MYFGVLWYVLVEVVYSFRLLHLLYNIIMYFMVFSRKRVSAFYFYVLTCMPPVTIIMYAYIHKRISKSYSWTHK